MSNDRAYYFARNRKEFKKDEANFRKYDVFKLAAHEKDKSSEDLWKMTVKEALNGFTSAEEDELKHANAFTSPKLQAMDQLSLRRLIETARASLSEEAVEYLLFCYGNFTLQHAAATEFLREEINRVWDEDFDEIEGGTGKLPEAFESRLTTTKLQKNCQVIRIEQNADRVIAHYRNGTTIGQAQGDYLLCTVPFPVLARIEASPPFSAAKQSAIRDLAYDSATKVALLTRNRFWEKPAPDRPDPIFGGNSITDLMTGPIFYPSDNATKRDPMVSEKPGVLLASYTWGQDARRLGAMDKSEREAFTIAQVRKVHPELTDDLVLASDSWVWDTYQWASGPFALYMPGQFTRMHRHVVAPEGRVHFAGEHCSRSHSWMQGALESAHHAVEALLAP
jgi:monoamine oxidase